MNNPLVIDPVAAPLPSPLPTPTLDNDRERDTEQQINLIDAMLARIGTRDVQGAARLLSTRRGLVDDLHKERQRRAQADITGDTAQLEAALIEAMGQMGLSSIRKIFIGVSGQLGVEPDFLSASSASSAPENE